MRKKKILITGANGLLGQKLIDLLHDHPEVDLVASSRGEFKLATVYPKVRFVSLDVTDREQVEAVFRAHRPTHLVHTAALTEVDSCEAEKERCWQLNVEAVSYLVEACEQYQVHLVHLSTDFIFDGTAGPYTEEDQPNPISYYGESKLAAEQLVRKSKGAWAIARTMLVYGIVHDYGRSNIVLWVKNSLEAQKKINVVDDQFRCPTLAEDLAKGCWLIIAQDAQGIFNISGQDFLTPYQMALQVADFYGLDESLINRVDGSSFTQPARRPLRTGFDIRKAQSQLGYSPVSFSEGIRVLASQLPKGV